jgi:large subunit ribosomal protein L13
MVTDFRCRRFLCCCCLRLQRLPERIIEHAVKGMLPKGRLGRKIRLHLKVYKGDKHPHAAQQPIDITPNIVSKRRSLPAKQ